MDPNLRQQVSRTPSSNGMPASSTPLQGIQNYNMSHYSTQLPPLQHHQMNGGMPQSYMGQGYRPDLSRQQPPTTTYTSASHMAPHNGVHSLPPSSFLTQPNQHYQQHQNALPTTSAPQSFQHIAPAPPMDKRLDMGTLPPGSYGQPDRPPAAWASHTSSPTNQQNFAPKEPPRTHVVGSQGRRGILPSAPGRAPAVSGGVTGTAKTNVAPQKNEDGKFPCQHCNKTYLHAKHLKRHLLRHTGDRPYMCVLCKDTFSRSDILKRHFQKCSIRRGNPQGVSHLSHPHAHLKRSQAAQAKAAANMSDATSSGMSTPTGSVNNNGAVNGVNGVNGVPAVNGVEPLPTSQYGTTPITTGTLPSTQTRYADAPTSIGFGMNGSNGNGYAPEQHNNAGWYGANQKQNSYLYHSPSGSPGPYNPAIPPAMSQAKPPQVQDMKRAMPQDANGHVQNGVDWTVFNPSGQEGYMQPFATSLGHGQEAIAAPADGDRKPYPTAHQGNGQHEGGMNGFYLAPTSLGGDGTLGSFELWNFDFSQYDPLQKKIERLVDFCFPPGLQEPLHPEQHLDKRALQEWLRPDHVKHFLEMSTHFQGHWPFIHSPSFNFVEAYDGLIMCVICLGAVYSERISASQVRSLMTLTKAGIQRTSRLIAASESGQLSDNKKLDPMPSDVEEMQAMIGLHVVSLWHGTAEQRISARSNNPNLAKIAKALGFLNLALENDSASFSVLHHLRPEEQVISSSVSWRTWIEQERRIRVMHMFFLVDSVSVVYFNCRPQYSLQNIRIPLPADDAAWDAKSEDEWQSAIGLRGPEIQLHTNPSGSRRFNQYCLHDAINALHSSTIDLESGSTNVYSKFILIHALEIQVCQVQKQLAVTGTTAELIMKNSPTPATQTISSTGEGTNSGRSTPSDGQSHPGGYAAQALLKSVFSALQKWKTHWDADMLAQYPASSGGGRRLGFCRDGGHFYWLARALLKSTRPQDWQAPADIRLLQVMNLLKRVRGWAQSDAAQRGEEMGSVGDIDSDFATSAHNLNLDMKLLFRPIEA